MRNTSKLLKFKPDVDLGGCSLACVTAMRRRTRFSISPTSSCILGILTVVQVKARGSGNVWGAGGRCLHARARG